MTWVEVSIEIARLAALKTSTVKDCLSLESLKSACTLIEHLVNIGHAPPFMIGLLPEGTLAFDWYHDTGVHEQIEITGDGVGELMVSSELGTEFSVFTWPVP